MRHIKLSLQLPLLVILAVLLTAVANSLLAILVGSSVFRTEELDHNTNSVQIYASAIGFYLDNARSVLETTADLPEMVDLASVTEFADPLRRDLPAEVDESKHRIATLILERSQVFEYVMILRANGSVYHLEPHAVLARLSRPDLSYTAWYKKLMSTRQTVVSDLHISPATQRPTVVIATPMRGADGQIVGIWAGGLKLEQLSRIGVGGLERGTPEQYGYVTDGRGLVIAHQAKLKYVQEQTDFSAVPPVRAALAGQQGAFEFVNPIEREEQLGAYMPLPGTQWTVVYVLPTRLALAPLEDLTRNLAPIAAVLAVVLGLVSVIVVRRVVEPLGRLTAAAERIGAGDFTQRIEVRTGDEIGRLATAFNTMAARVGELTSQLRATIAELLTPAIPLREGLLAMPLVGAIDTARARQITDTLLQEIVRRRARVVILDISGVPMVDTAVVKHLSETIAAARLMGVRVIVSGISPRVAQTLVGLDVDWGGVRTVHSMEQAMEMAQEVLR